jgi:hypothetical protein
VLKRLLREPLVHFLGIGLLLFGLYALVGPSDTGGDKIVVSRAMVSEMKARHAGLWGRPPTEAELNGLIDTRIRDEILYREGLAMGLDKDDAVIKRRVRQKYDLIAEEEDSRAASEADLQAWLTAHPDSFRAPPVVDFRQIMVPLNGSDAEVKARLERTAAALAEGRPPEPFAAASLLPGTVPATPLDLVARDFGGDFAEALATAPTGQWVGPIASAFGVHFVRIGKRTPSAIPPLEQIRPQVAREWENDRRLKAREARLAELRKRYDVVIEGTTEGVIEGAAKS